MRWSPTIAVVTVIAGLIGASATSNATELVQDGGFEGGTGSPAWAQADSFATNGTPLCSLSGPEACWDLFGSRAAPRSGQWWAWFGGYTILGAVTHTASLRQAVQISAGTPATLSFWLWAGRGNAASALNVSLGGTTLFAIRGDDPRYQHGYVQVVIPISGATTTGGPQTLSFDYAGSTSLLQYPAVNIDDVSLQVADADLGVGLSSTPTTVNPGATFTTTLSAGNAGPHDAGEVRAEYPLPAGATLVGLSGDASCAAPQTAPGHVMHCDFGTLPAGATKAVTIALQAGAAGTITQSASLPQRTGDPNGSNHVAHSTVTVVAPPPPPGEVPKPPDKPKVTCTAPRRFTVPLRRGRKGNGLMIGSYSTAKSRITSARLTGPKKFKARKLRHTKSRVTLDLRRIPAGRYTVRTRVRVSSKRTINVTRVYNACGPAAKTAPKASTTTATKK